MATIEEYYTKDEVYDAIPSRLYDEFMEYLYGWDDAIVNDTLKKEYVDMYCHKIGVDVPRTTGEPTPPDASDYTTCRTTVFYYKVATDQEWQKGTCEICVASGHIDAIAPHILRGISGEDGAMFSSFTELRDPQLVKRLAQFIYDQREEYVADASLLMLHSHDEISGLDFRAAGKILDIVRGTE